MGAGLAWEDLSHMFVDPRPLSERRSAYSDPSAIWVPLTGLHLAKVRDSPSERAYQAPQPTNFPPWMTGFAFRQAETPTERAHQPAHPPTHPVPVRADGFFVPWCPVGGSSRAQIPRPDFFVRERPVGGSSRAQILKGG
jgi:hypothetical protein